MCSVASATEPADSRPPAKGALDGQCGTNCCKAVVLRVGWVAVAVVHESSCIVKVTPCFSLGFVWLDVVLSCTSTQ